MSDCRSLVTDTDFAPLPPDAPWVVLKFGGTSVASEAHWRTIAELTCQRRRAGMRVMLVVSACAGVTDTLSAMCLAEPAHRRRALKQLAQQHRGLAEALHLPRIARMEADFDSLEALLEQDPPDVAAYQAEVTAHGELFSSALGVEFLRSRGLSAEWLDARECLAAEALPLLNARAQRLATQAAVAADPERRENLASVADVWITQGFIVRDPAGGTALLGRGGSDTSAACFGVLLEAKRVEIWTDVAGMFSADPRQVPAARLLKRLDYEEAQEIATTGARVLHPRCLSPLRRARVPLLILDTRRPELPGTSIGPRQAEAADSIKAISSRRGITLVSMESVGMWQQVGFLADVFELFKRHGLSVDLIGSAETNVTVSLDPGENLLDSDVVAALAADLARVCRVKVIAPCAAVTLVGRGMRSMLHRLSDVLAEFGQRHVHLISQSSNNLNLTFVVDEEVTDGLLPRLHELLIRAGVLRSDDSALFGDTWQTLYGAAAAAAPTAWWRGERARLLDQAGQGTPRYVYHLATARARAREIRAMHSVDRVLYAMKANPHPRVLAALAGEGLGLECVSPGELERAGEIAGDGRPLFTPNFAPREEYAAALAGDARVTLDALHPLRHWPELFARRELALRLDLGRGLGHHEKVRTGGADSKFGLPLDQLDEFLDLAGRASVRIVGLHAHLGSGILDVSHWVEVYSQLASLAERIDSRIDSVNWIDIGGGLGVPAYPGEVALDLGALDAALGEVKRAYPQYALWMEPGRFLVAEAGVLLARVTQIKRKGARAYLGVDAGMNSLLRPALYGAWHEIVNLTRLEAAADTLYQVVGPICESGDVLGVDRRMPRAQEGDVILVAQAGAYGAVMGSHYNLRKAAEELIIE